MSPSSWYKTFMAAAGVTVGSYKPEKSEPGPPMTLANMRNNHVRRLIVYPLPNPQLHDANRIRAGAL